MALPLVLAVLEVAHPTAPSGSLTEAARSSRAWWIALHVALIVGYALLVPVLWRDLGRLGRALLLVFAACNTAFLAIDGLGIGVLAVRDPVAANALSASTAVAVLADATGALWAAALLAVALAWWEPAHPGLVALGDTPSRAARPVLVAVAVTWTAMVASAVVPTAALVSRGVAVVVGAAAVYARGASHVPFALLVFAAVLRQHIGSEAALGMVCLAAAFALEGRPATGRSAPAASCRP